MPANPAGAMMRAMKRLARAGRIAPLTVAGCLLLCARAAGAAGVGEEDWFDALIARIQQAEARGVRSEFAPYVSDICRGGEPARLVEVDTAGAARLHLFVTGDPDKVWGMANWGEPVLIAADGRQQSLTLPAREGEGRPALDWVVRLGRRAINLNLHSGLYEPMRTAGRQFRLGIHVQADSHIEVPLEGKYVRFRSWIGVDDYTRGRGNVRFAVLDDRAAVVEGAWPELELRFSHAEPRREMRRERLDGIWRAAWQRLDFGALARAYAEACAAVPPLARQAETLAAQAHDPAGVRRVRALYHRACDLREAIRRLEDFDREALELAVRDLRDRFGARYPDGDRFLEELATLWQRRGKALAAVRQPGADLGAFEQVARLAAALEALKRRALLANPLLDFEELLVMKRRPKGDPRRSQWDAKGLGEFLGLPRQSSWGYGTVPNVDQWDNEIAVVRFTPQGPEFRTLYDPPGRRLLADMDLHWEGRKLAFAMPDDQLSWQVWELDTRSGRVRQLTPSIDRDIHNYDPCYLPNDRLVFISTAPLQGVPCNASVIVGMMYQMEADGSGIRQVCFEQDHDYTPSVLNDGRVLYLRWDYTDTPHVWNRLLMTMNPDGTGQQEFYGSNGYWPNAIFFARAVPGHPTMVAAIVTGHHEGRVGELVLIDPARGRREAAGIVQRIPGRGRPVIPTIEDKPTEHSWPKFLHPWPLDEHYLIVSAKPSQDDLWGIYLVDTFDNMVLLCEQEEFGLFEPIPFRPRPRPPVIPDQVQPDRNDAIVYLQDVYRGPGLDRVPRGTIKQLRVFTYHFGFQHLAGIDHRVGTDGPWEVKRVLGTVPVQPDGSALFRVPAKTPLSFQPLDANGQAVALMRSWMTAQPGEFVSCVGCHEHRSSAGLAKNAMALAEPPAAIEPWHGPPRGFSFAREVQPVLDRYCVGCHDGRPGPAGREMPDLRADQGRFVVYRHGDPDLRVVEAASKQELIGKYAGVFEPSYIALRKFVRVGGLESDLHPLPPGEFHADTSELVQMLRKGHHNVRLDAEAWDRLITWIDLNAPCQGSWSETHRIPGKRQPERRFLLRLLYGGVPENCEILPEPKREPIQPVIPPPEKPRLASAPACDGWPFDALEAARRQAATGPTTLRLDLGEGVAMELVRIPAGRFVMGDRNGAPDEWPLRVVEIRRPFWMGRFEVTNEQFGRYDPAHDSRFEHRSSWIFDESYLGWPLNRPRQPVVRVSWEEAMGFCRWLSARTGLQVTLPTEEQWEYACRAGTATPLFYGEVEDDFSPWANLADANLRRLATEGWRPKAPDLVPRIDGVDDGALVTAEVGSYAPNPWGLHDMHGNAAEWTRTIDPADPERRIVRGGSWRDRPHRARSAFRLSYPAWRKVFNVGFRVVVEEPETPALAGNPPAR
ncbi:MAG: hypothetical protein D6766_09025 [Verrucomicrobia bacterium]|nr:MAG: hypothetical protein D6766_09025 [Verrucomicrobiota bacterium]